MFCLGYKGSQSKTTKLKRRTLKQKQNTHPEEERVWKGSNGKDGEQREGIRKASKEEEVSPGRMESEESAYVMSRVWGLWVTGFHHITAYFGLVSCDFITSWRERENRQGRKESGTPNGRPRVRPVDWIHFSTFSSFVSPTSPETRNSSFARLLHPPLPEIEIRGLERFVGRPLARTGILGP